MPENSKIQSPGKKFNQIFDEKSLQRTHKKIDDENEDVTTVFKDLHISALTKAVNISPNVNSVTLGLNSPSDKRNFLVDKDLPENVEDSISGLSIPHCSTPKKNASNEFSYHVPFIKVKQKKKSLSPSLLEEKTTSSDNSILCQKLLQEYDFQRRLTVDKVMRERIQNMYDRGKLIQDSLEHLMQTKNEEALKRRMLSESKIISDIQEQEILNKPRREAQWEKEYLKEVQRIQERNQKVREAIEESRKKSEAILHKKKQILFELQREYNQEYKDMLETIKSCQNKALISELTSTHSKTLKDCAAICEGVLKKCKQGDVTEEDVQTSKRLVETIKSIHELFSNEIIKINENEKLKKNENEIAQPKEEEKTTVINEAQETSVSSDLSDCFDARFLELYKNSKSRLENFEKTVSPLLSDDSMKKFKFDCQKAVTIPVNAISPVSGSHLSDKYLKLHNLLAGRMVEVGETKVMASQHPLGIAFCKRLLAKKFVRQGDLTVSSKPDAAFCIAAVLVSLWIDFPDFGQLVLANFHMACPYLAPVFMPQLEGQSDEDYHKSLGYHYSQNGTVEKQDSFLKRMSGIMRLYAALLISRPRQPGKINPLGLSEGWRWISALLNLKPRPDICATLLYDFLEVSGSEMFKAYGGQFKKLLAYICQEYLPELEKVTPASAGGPIVRLEDFLQKILQEESIPPPRGMLPPNFW